MWTDVSNSAQRKSSQLFSATLLIHLALFVGLLTVYSHITSLREN